MKQIENLIGKQAKVFLSNCTTLSGVIVEDNEESLLIKNDRQKRGAQVQKQYIIAITFDTD